MKKDCLMQYKDITRVEVIDSIGGRAYVNSNANMPTISFQDGGKTLKVFVHSIRDIIKVEVDEDNDTIFDPMNVIIVGGVPYSFEDVEEFITEAGWYTDEEYESEMEMHRDCFNDIVNRLHKQSKDTSLEAWQKEVVAGNTTSGYIAWKNEA